VDVLHALFLRLLLCLPLPTTMRTSSNLLTLALTVGGLCLSAIALPASAAVIAAPALDNKAYVVMDFDSGQVLSAVNADQALPPASLTKMMTSYLVEQALKSGRLKPTDMVSVSLNAWCRGTSAESCMYLPLNGQASVIDMLRGIIIQSGNDASKAVAEHLAGTEDGFAKLMNTEAKRLGMKQTNFVNPTGLPDPNHKASAYDLALLARAIIHDSSEYYPIYAEREFKYNGIKQGNRNALLYTDPTVDGLKTGHTDEAGYCLTASAKRGDMRLITVVMGARTMPARADQTRALLNWGYSNFERAVLAQAGASLGTAVVQFGKVEMVQAGLARNWAITVPRGQVQQMQTVVQAAPNLTAPIEKGAVVGQLVAMLDGKPYASQPLIAMEAVERAGFFKSTWQRVRNVFK
jgi:D-alanyl-D-alanine carboxypeptidase (penicillin-binding protein 5/6)